nr:MAG TPA: hypothetical protein [Caudoviricetes sp.]
MFSHFFYFLFLLGGGGNVRRIAFRTVRILQLFDSFCSFYCLGNSLSLTKIKETVYAYRIRVCFVRFKSAFRARVVCAKGGIKRQSAKKSGLGIRIRTQKSGAGVVCSSVVFLYISFNPPFYKPSIRVYTYVYRDF